MMLNQDMQTLHQYLECWRLKLSIAKITITAFHLNNKDIQCHFDISVNSAALPNNDHPVYLGEMLDHTLTYRQHIESLKCKVNGRNALLCCLAVQAGELALPPSIQVPSLWCTAPLSMHHPCGAAVLTSPSWTRASMTPCVLSLGVCIQQRLPSYTSLLSSTTRHLPRVTCLQ